MAFFQADRIHVQPGADLEPQPAAQDVRSGQAKIEGLILQGDWTRSPKPTAPKIAAKALPVVLPAKPLPPLPSPAPWLPGFEDFAASGDYAFPE